MSQGEFEGMNVYVPHEPAMFTDNFNRTSLGPRWQTQRPYVIEGPNHALHFVLTLLTCGLWLPIWLLVALTNHKKIRYL